MKPGVGFEQFESSNQLLIWSSVQCGRGTLQNALPICEPVKSSTNRYCVVFITLIFNKRTLGCLLFTFTHREFITDWDDIL